MADQSDIFHFPRAEEARRYLALLENGDAQALTLFGPRRSGKTRFLLRDLAPLAERRRIRTVYVSFWQDQDAPQDVLAAEIERRLHARTPQAIKKLFASLDAKATLTTPNLPGVPAASVTMGAREKTAQRKLLQIDALFEEICGARSKALFLLDEVQQLAVSQTNGAFVKQLRTSLDKRRGRAFAVFTGSSEAGLNAMFSKQSAALFGFGNRIVLDKLGPAFIAHQQAALNIRGVPVGAAALAKAFTALGERPYDFEIFRNKLIVRPKPDVDAILAETLAERAAHLGFPQAWRSLSPLHKATLRELASGDGKPFTEEAVKRIGRLGGRTALTAQTLQGALRTLTRRGLVQQFEKGGLYSFVDDAFAGWLLNAPD